MSYTANDLQTLAWNESVQRRTGMYLGAVAKDSDTPGQKNVAIREIVDNSTTESVKGKCNKIFIEFRKDGFISVLDDGRGIPVDTDENGVNGIDKCIATLHSGGNFTISEKNGSGLNGVGAACSNAVSSSFKVEVLKGKFVFTKEYSNGEPLGKMNKKKFDPSVHPFKEDFKSGTCVTFKLNDEFFEPQDLVHPEDIIERMRYTAYILPGLEINIQDNSRSKENGGGFYSFKNQEGIKELVEFISDNTPSLIKGKDNWEKKGIFSFENNVSYDNKGRKDKAFVDVAFQYTQSDKTDIRSFANTVQTFNGGIHEEAIRNAFYNVFKQKDTIEEDVTTGLLAVISVNLPEPQFSSQAKVKLTGKNAGDAIEKLVTREIRKWNNSLSPEEQKAIEKHVKDNAKIRKAAEVAKVAKKKSLNKTNNFNLPSNLKDCSKIGDKNSELYICEGLSAAGTILAARDSKYQGVLPVRGKCLNVWGMDLSKKNQLKRFQENAEIADMVKALGAGMMDSFDIDKVRYERVCFSTDSDSDGFCISTLLTGIFYKLFRPLLEEGRVYLVCSPLFIIETKKKTYYALNDIEKNKIVKELNKKGEKYELNRAKGIGELQKETFSDVVLNPENRKLRQLTVEDGEEATKWLDLCLAEGEYEYNGEKGFSSNARKLWMTEYSSIIEELDLN